MEEAIVEGANCPLHREGFLFNCQVFFLGCEELTADEHYGLPLRSLLLTKDSSDPCSRDFSCQLKGL